MLMTILVCCIAILFFAFMPIPIFINASLHNDTNRLAKVEIKLYHIKIASIYVGIENGYLCLSGTINQRYDLNSIVQSKPNGKLIKAFALHKSTNCIYFGFSPIGSTLVAFIDTARLFYQDNQRVLIRADFQFNDRILSSKTILTTNVAKLVVFAIFGG